MRAALKSAKFGPILDRRSLRPTAPLGYDTPMPIRLFFRAPLAALAFTVAVLSGPAVAQSYDPYNLEERLQRIEDQLRDLQDQMYQGGGAPVTGGGAGAGPSMDRLNDLEQSVRNLTGQVEQFGYDVRTMKDRLDRLETETNFRLNQLEGNPGGAAPAGGGAGTGSGGADPAGTGTEVTPPPGGGGSGEPKPPGTIGDVPVASAQSGSAADLYSQAMDLLTKSDYEAALKLFRQVVQQHPTSDEAAQAQYWIADIYYVQKDYAKAAAAFAEVLKKYPQAGRGPEAMLKLGLSLVNSGKKKEGCTAFKAIKQKYPKASDAILSRADREAKKAGCS